MTCDECGQVLDEDDEIDCTGANYSVTDSGWSRNVKARCPNCGHIQYGQYSEFDDGGGFDSPWYGILDEEDSD